MQKQQRALGYGGKPAYGPIGNAHIWQATAYQLDAGRDPGFSTKKITEEDQTNFILYWT